MSGIFDSTRFLDPREAMDVARIRATVLYLGYGLLLASFFYPWATVHIYDEVYTEYAFGVVEFGMGPLAAVPFFVFALYGLFAPFQKIGRYGSTVRGYSGLVGLIFSVWGYSIVIHPETPRIGSYLAIVGGIALLIVNAFELFVHRRLIRLVEET